MMAFTTILFLLSIILIVLKLIAVISISWFLALLPIMIDAAIGLIIILSVIIHIKD